MCDMTSYLWQHFPNNYVDLTISTTDNTLQHTASKYHTVQHTATHCNTLQHTPNAWWVVHFHDR